MIRFRMRHSLLIAAVCTIFFSCIAVSMEDNHKSFTDGQRLLLQENELEHEGRALEKIGDFDGAAKKYMEASRVAILIYGSNKGRPLAFLAEVYEKQGKYEKALPIVESLLEFHPDQENYKDWVEELMSLVRYQKTGNKEEVINYIHQYQKKYQSALPPIGTNMGTPDYLNRIFALYDMAGAPDDGISCVDGVLDYIYKTSPKISRTSKSDVAMDKINSLQHEGNNAEAYSYRVLREFLLVREAFELDKKDGTKGRAIKALIESEYFPW